MDKQEIERELSNLMSPEPESSTHQQQFKMYLLNARRSAGWGTALVILPFIMLLGVVLKYRMGVDWGFVNAFEEWLTQTDESPTWGWLGPFFLLGLPMIAAVINLLALLHIDISRKQTVITLRHKTWNLIILGVCLLILGALFLYLIVENVNHP